MPTVAFLSFRLGLDDGVSIVANTWRRIFRELGWSTYAVAGTGPVDRTILGLEIGSAGPPTAAALERALEDADLVVVENLLTIPMNLEASRVVAKVLSGRPAFLHHHDPPWQRERFAHITELPASDPAWYHITINSYTEAQFVERGLTARTIHNGFDTDVAPGDRDRTRKALGIKEGELLFAHPVRAIKRKNIPRALEIATAAGATYWLTGQAEEGYGPELRTLLASAGCRVIHKPATTAPDIYAAADLVLFPSHWEGFGNPPIEAAIHLKPVVVGNYPVAEELSQLGFHWLDADLSPANIDRIRMAGTNPNPLVLTANREVAVENLSLKRTTLSVKSLLIEAGLYP